MIAEEVEKPKPDCLNVIKECLIFYTTVTFALVAIFRYKWLNVSWQEYAMIEYILTLIIFKHVS